MGDPEAETFPTPPSITTDSALVVFQDRVASSSNLMLSGEAESVMVGWAGGAGWGAGSAAGGGGGAG